MFIERRGRGGPSGWAPLLFGLVVLASVSPEGARAQQEPGRQAALAPEGIAAIRDRILERDGRAIIGLKPVEATEGMLADGRPALAPDQVESLVESLAPMGVTLQRRLQLIPAVVVQLDVERLDELLANPSIDYVEPDHLVEPMSRPGLRPPGDQRIPWGIQRVNAPAVWSVTKGAGVRVGIIDTGIHEGHPDLNPIGGINTVTGGTTRADWDDVSPECGSHGTHVAGTVAALDNDLLLVGVAPEVELYAIRVFDPEAIGEESCGAFNSDVILGLEWAVQNGLQVVNMSLGFLFASLAMRDAVFAASMADVLVVAAAGNTGSEVVFPAGFPEAVAVAAIDDKDERAEFSSMAPEVELAAPGVDVESTVNTGGTAVYSGTSMAAPHAAGVAALIRAVAPGLGVADVREILRTTAQDILAPGYDEASGWGVVDGLAAVNALVGGHLALSAVPSDIVLQAEPGGPPATVSIALRSVGSPGVIAWSAAPGAGFLGVAPTSGIASDEAPGLLEVTADATGLATGTHTGFITISSNAVNDPVDVRVRVRVTPRIVLDAEVATVGELGPRDRHRYVLAGEAGQAIDLLLLRDTAHANPLPDPFLRLYGPDGEAVLALSDDAWSFGLELQSLIHSFVLPETADYFVEVGSYFDCCSGGYILKARPAGPILAFYSESAPGGAWGRTVEGGPPAATCLWPYEATGLGPVSWSASSPDPWITIDPTSGIARRVAFAMDPAPQVHPGPPTGRHTYVRSVAERKLPGPQLVEAKLDALELDSVSRSAHSTLPCPDSEWGTGVTLTLDPAGFEVGGQIGTVAFDTEDGWIPHRPVAFLWLYTPGMTIVSEDQGQAIGVAMVDPETAVVSAGFSDGRLVPVTAGGAMGFPTALPSGLRGFPGGVTVGADRAYYASVWRWQSDDHAIVRVEPGGAFSTFVELGDENAWHLATGPGGDIFATDCFRTWRIQADGSGVEPIATGASCPQGIAYRPQNNKLYVAGLLSGLHVVDLDDGSFRQVIPGIGLRAVASLSRKGRVYFGNELGELYVMDPDSPSGASLLGVVPHPAGITDMALVEGALIMTYWTGEIYRFPVDDGPPAGGGFMTARLGVEAIDALREEPFRVPLHLDLSATTATATRLRVRLEWPPALLSLQDVTEGDLGGEFHAETGEAGGGVLRITVTPGEGAGAALHTLAMLDFSLDPSVDPGRAVDLTLAIEELRDPEGADLRESAIARAGRICAGAWPWGDVTRDGTVASGDAVQILRHVAGLPLAPDSDVRLGDVSRDGVVNLVDAVQILRHTVELPIPAESRVGRFGVGACPGNP